MNITRMLSEIKEVSDLENIVTILEGYYDIAITKALHMPYEKSSHLTILEIKEKAQEVSNWIDDRLESGYYSGNEETLSALRSTKGAMAEILEDIDFEKISEKRNAKMVNLELLKKADYSLLGDMADEKDVLESFVNEYSEGYACDVISEIADGAVPIYYDDIWEDARNIKDYIKEAQEEGLAEGVTDIEKIIQIGYYQYYQTALYNNLDTMVYNKVIQSLNEYLTAHEITGLDMEALELAIEEHTSGYDNNNRIDDIEDIIKEIVEELTDGAYRMEDVDGE